MQKKRQPIAPIKHGLRSHPLYNVWSGIKDRCYNTNSHDYHNYGGRGVRMCDQWITNFKLFYDWCIKKEWKRGLQIDKDKIGNGLLYSPETCCLLSLKENNRLKPTKLDQDIANVIRASNESQRKLAKKYHVAKGTIQKIIENKIWT